MIFVSHFDETSVKIDADVSIISEISDAFRFRADGYKFQQKYKMGVWDGYIRMMDVKNSLFPKGLISELVAFAQDREYEIKIDKCIMDLYKLPVGFSWDSLHLAMEPHDFQKTAVARCIEKKRQIILSSTGSGKSLIIYSTIRAYLPVVDEKILLIVPSVALVNQMYSDFENYSKDDPDFDVGVSVHKLYSGEDKNSPKRIIISTYQSLLRMTPEYMSQFECVLFDEVHTCAGKEVAQVMNKCRNAFFRFGFTGTLQDSKVNEMQMKALFGPIYRVSETRDLMDRRILAELKIKSIILKHDGDIVVQAGKKEWTYQKEIDALVRSQKRNEFITKLVASRSSNTLVLFQFVEKHGKQLKVMFEHACPDKRVFFVFGGTDADQREDVRKIVESHNNVIILASYALFQQGISINNLHNIVFASPSKSKIRVLQSIGRGLRLHKDKSHCTLFDIGDDLRGTRKKINHTLEHAMERYKFYMNEKFQVEVIQR